MSIIECDYTNVLQQELFKVRKDTGVDPSALTAIEYMPHIDDYKVLSQSYTETIQIPNPCNPDDPTDLITVTADLKQVVVVATLKYSILLLGEDNRALYAGEGNCMTVYDIYGTIPADQELPEVLDITPVFDLEPVYRIQELPEVEDRLEYYTFTVDGTVSLSYI